MSCRSVVVGFVVALACCAGDKGIDSGLPPDKPADELEPAEQVTLCEAALDHYEATISQAEWTRYMCTFEAFGDAREMASDTAGQIAACKMLVDACVAAGAESQSLACDPSDGLVMCSATVGQIETCFEDAIDLLGSLITDFNCDILDPARAEALQAKYGPAIEDPFPASCDAVEASCPELLGAEEVDAEGTDSPPPAAALRQLGGLTRR